MDSLHCNFINDTHIGANSVSFSPQFLSQFVKALQQVTVFIMKNQIGQKVYISWTIQGFKCL